jgi:predicted amidohydrolase YtcJ
MFHTLSYAAFEEDVKGSITPGQLADLVVLSKDIMKIPEAERREVKHYVENI